MVHFGGEYELCALTLNCAWMDHNNTWNNACTDGKFHLHEDNHQPSEFAKFQIDFLIFKYMPFACYYTTCYEAMLSDSLIMHILYLIFSFQTAEYSLICLFIGIILHRCMSTKPCSWCLQSKSWSHQYLHFSYFVLQHEWKTLNHLIVCFFFWKAPGQTIPDFTWTLLYHQP